MSVSGYYRNSGGRFLEGKSGEQQNIKRTHVLKIMFYYLQKLR